jgi:hypothetical protein
MHRPRRALLAWPRLRLRGLMILAAVAALALGAEMTRRRWAYFREKAVHHAAQEKGCLHMSEGALDAITEATQEHFISYRNHKNEDLEGLEEFEEAMREQAEHWRTEAAKHASKEEEYLSRWW